MATASPPPEVPSIGAADCPRPMRASCATRRFRSLPAPVMRHGTSRRPKPSEIPVNHKRSAPLLIGMMALLIAGCAAPGATVDPSSLESLPVASATSRPSPNAGLSTGDTADAPAGIPDEVWTAVLEDLSRRVERPIVDPVISSAKSVTWNDGSLGCPKPGLSYTQALVDGFQVIVEVDGEQFDYRSAGGDSVRLCEGVIQGG